MRVGAALRLRSPVFDGSASSSPTLAHLQLLVTAFLEEALLKILLVVLTTISVAMVNNKYWPIYLSIANIHNNVH